jgi:hypothetical protein
LSLYATRTSQMVRTVLLGFSGMLATCFAAEAQVVIAPPPTVGSSNPVSAEPLVTRPATTPCKVSLFQNLEFNDYNSRTYAYTPPTACPGPWAKVVFSMDVTVTAGVQYDRSSQVFLNNVTLFRGTTAEPAPGFSPSWHVERDVTDLSAVFGTAAAGEADIQNIVNSTYTGIVYANAELDFYPASETVPAAVTPNVVLPVYAGDASNIYQAASPLTEAITFPLNTTQVYLDVTEQAQSDEEFWYYYTPNAQVAPYFEAQEGTALREIDVTIDGTPAGLAPRKPYIFTGGIDPNLWIPITGAQTLDLKPYRINLTPFAGLLTDGKPHTFVINDVNQLSYSLITGNLLVYTDPGGATVTGAVVSNTLTPLPATTVTSNVDLDSDGNGTAEVSEGLLRTFAISGYVNTSQGKVTTTVAETVNFVNDQQLTNSSTSNVTLESLTSTVDATVTTVTPSATTTQLTHTSNPLQVVIGFAQNTDGTYNQTTTADMKEQNNLTGPGSFNSNAQEEVTSTDALTFDASFDFLGSYGQASEGTYFANDSAGNTYSSTLTASDNVLTGVTSAASSAAVTVFVSSSAGTIAQGSAVTLTALVTPGSSTLIPAGYVTFYLAGTPAPTVLGSAPVTSTGAALTIANLPVGSDAITASYSGDGNFTGKASLNAVTVNVTAVAPTFAFGTPSPAGLSVAAGQTGVTVIPVTANVSFSGAVSFSCTGAPAESTCTVSPASLTLTPGQVASVTVVVATTAPNNSSQAANHTPGMTRALGGVALAGLLLVMWPRRRRMGSLILLLVIGVYATGSLTGCGSSSPTYKYTGTPAGMSTLTITGTAGASTVTTTVTLAVTQ